ncbi:MAG: hypothetical protein DIU78_015625 [Pseudomonadota bacterium]
MKDSKVWYVSVAALMLAACGSADADSVPDGPNGPVGGASGLSPEERPPSETIPQGGAATDDELDPPEEAPEDEEPSDDDEPDDDAESSDDDDENSSEEDEDDEPDDDAESSDDDEPANEKPSEEDDDEPADDEEPSQGEQPGSKPISGLPDDATRVIGPEEAREVAEEVASIFRPFAESAHGATIEISPPPWDGEVGLARASVHPGRIWRITPTANIFNPYLTRDVMRLLVCHELGHFFAGFPFGEQQTVKEGGAKVTVDEGGTYLASEGSADYFATKDCAWIVWAGDPNNAAFRSVVPVAGRRKCDVAWPDQARRDICYRSLVIAQDMIRWIWNPSSTDISNGYRIDTPSTDVNEITIRGHYHEQCRLDTMVAGAVCTKPNDLRKIPGLVPSPVTGQYGDHSVASEQDAARYACHEGPGARPACWFKPNMPDYVPTNHCADFPIGGVCADDDSGYWDCDPDTGPFLYKCENGCDYENVDDIRLAVCAEPLD